MRIKKILMRIKRTRRKIITTKFGGARNRKINGHWLGVPELNTISWLGEMRYSWGKSYHAKNREVNESLGTYIQNLDTQCPIPTWIPKHFQWCFFPSDRAPGYSSLRNRITQNNRPKDTDIRDSPIKLPGQYPCWKTMVNSPNYVHKASHQLFSAPFLYEHRTKDL